VNESRDDTSSRQARLFELLAGYESIVVAYSGGVDSAYLAWAANRARPGQVLCVTADSPSYPRRHRDIAEAIARQFQLPHEFVHTSELERPEYRANPANRCYHCKTELYEHLARLAHDRGFDVIVDGSNADDRGDYRPGRQAAREFGVCSPLDEADLTKTEIRALAREAGLPIWDEPASACLSSRIPYQSEVTEAKLATIEAAEEIVRALGFRVFRVRHHDTLARLEIGRDEMARAFEPDINDALVSRLKAIGYQYVSLDLQGYRTGSLNEVLRLRPV
jgi:pyridinium-3,5-biscarboxylic acid mononucleotide sulfurtransferase